VKHASAHTVGAHQRDRLRQLVTHLIAGGAHGLAPGTSWTRDVVRLASAICELRGSWMVRAVVERYLGDGPLGLIPSNPRSQI
jgi:hypothetical protein